MPSFRRIADSRKTFTISRDRSIQFSGVNGEIDMTGLTTISGARIDEKSSLRIAAVWIATSLLADEVGGLVFKLIAKDDKTRRPVEPPELEPLWGMANPDQTPFGFRATMTLSLLLGGVSLTQLGWLNNGSLGRMWPIDPSNIRYERLDDQGIRITAPGQGSLTNRPGQRPEFMMIPLYQFPGQLEPMSPVKYAAELLGLGATYDRTAANLAGRGFNPAAILTFGDEIDDGVAKKFSAELSRLHGGAANRGKVAVIGGKDPKLQPFSMSLADAQFMAQNDRVFALTMAIWRVPPTVVGMVDKPSTWGTGVAEFARGLERFTTRPIVQRIQDGVENYITRWVDPGIQWRGRFDSLLSAAPKDRTEIQRQQLMNGMTSVERILAQNDEPPFEDGETMFSALSQAGEEDRRLARLRQQSDIYGSLIRAGVTPDAAAAVAGFDPNTLTSLGLPPAPAASADPAKGAGVESKTPIDLTVNVDLPAVSITNEAQPAPEAAVRKVRKQIKRDGDGNIAEIVETEE